MFIFESTHVLKDEPPCPRRWEMAYYDGATFASRIAVVMKICCPQVEWKDSYRIGIPLLDAEHKNLFLAINTYIDSIHLGRGVKFSQTVIDTIVDYAETHFKREESMMLEKGYPNLAEHKRDHNKFIIDVADYKKLQLDGFGVDEELGRFLGEWITNHEIDEDAQMKDFFQSTNKSF